MSTSFRFFLFACCLFVSFGFLAGGTAFSQSRDTIQVPMVGLVYDPSVGYVRAIVGVPGASTLSHALELPSEIRNIYFSPAQNYSVVERQGGSVMGLLSFSGLSVKPIVDLPTDIARPTIVSFSPLSSAVVVHSRLEGRTQIIRGLPAAPERLREIHSDDLPPDLQYLALADDGQTLVAGTSNGIYLVRESQPPVLLRSMGGLCGMAFLPRLDSIVLAEKDGGRVSVLQNVSTAPSIRLLAQGLPEMQGEIRLNFENGRAVISSRGSSKVRLIDINTGQIQNLEFPTVASAVVPLAAASRSLLLSYSPGEPAWVLDLNGARAIIYFVPAQNSGEN